MKKTILLFCSAMLAIVLNAQVTGDYRSAGTVNLNTTANWEVFNGTSWNAAPAAVSPNAANLTSGTITILAGHTWNNNAGTVVVPSGVTLVFKGVAGTFTAGAITLNGTYVHFSTAAAATVYTGMTIATNSTFIYRASSAVQPSATFNGRTYYNLMFDTDGTTVANPTFSSPGIIAPNSLIVNGTFTVNNWGIDLYSASNTGATNFNGSIVLTGTNTYLGLKPTTIGAGNTVTIGATDSLFVTSSAFVVNGTLLNQSTKAINLKSSATMTINGTYQHDANGGAIPNTGATYSSGSLINVTGVTNVNNIPTLPTTIGGNVIWNCPAQSSPNTFINTNSNSTTIGGNLTITSTGTANIYLGGASTARTLTVNGNLIVNGGKMGIIKPAALATANQICTVAGDVVVPSGELYIADPLTGATAYTGKGFLNIGGSLNHTGGIFGSGTSAYAATGILTFNTNNSDRTITSTGFTGRTNVIIDKTAAGSVTLASALNIADSTTLNVATGTFNLNGFTTTLKSTSATNSARVYVATGAAINQSATNSKFTVEQYIPGGTRSFRFMGHPFSTAISLSELADDIDITGNDGNAAVVGTGFSVTGTNNASAYWYDPITGNGSTSAGWIAFTRADGMNAAVGNTSNTWKVGQGVRALVRGPKGQSGVLSSSPVPDPVTINLNGKVNDGNDVVVTLTKGTNSGFNLVSNPYCAPLDMFQFRTANSNANASAGNNFYVWLPTGGVNGKGQYITGDMTASGETYRYLPAYSSFFVDVASTTSAIFKEAHKAASTQAAAYSLRTSTTSAYGKNSIQLQVSRNNAFEDRILIFLNNDKATAAYDNTDAVKLANSGLNFYTLSSDNKQLAIDRRVLDKNNNMIIPLGFGTNLTADYSIDVKDLDVEAGTTVYLKDKLLNTETLLQQGVSYPFNASANNAAEGRFELLFKKSIPVVIAPTMNEFSVKWTPNPVSEVLTISFTNKEKANTSIRVINALGQEVETINAGNVQATQLKVNVSKWSKGAYYITLNNGIESKVQQVQVQ